MNVFNEPIITNAVMNHTISSAAIPIVNSFGYTVQAVYTGTPTGSLKLQGSNDKFEYVNAAQPQVPTNWNDIKNSSFSITSAGICTWNVQGPFYNYVRLVFTDGSGGLSTAVLNATFNAKGY